MSRACPVNRARGEILSRDIVFIHFPSCTRMGSGQPDLPESRLSETRVRFPTLIYEHWLSGLASEELCRNACFILPRKHAEIKNK